MSPKVLETWINETLADAEHLDIPGVILKTVLTEWHSIKMGFPLI